MAQLTTGKLFELYIETINRCDKNLIHKSDLDIEDSIFDIFFGGIISYFYKDSLAKLKSEGLIDELIEVKSLHLRSIVINLRETVYWDIKSFKNCTGWNDIMNLCYELKKLIQERWSQEELEYLFTH